MALGPKLTIPTGYESEQRAIERRRKIAEALLQQGLQQNPNMTSPWQAIAQVANAFIGRRMEKKADQRSDELSTRIKGDFDTATTEFNNDAATLQPSQLVAKYRNNPMMAENLKPYEAALQRALTEREALTTFNGKMQRQGDVVGQYDQGKPTDLVLRDGQGNFQPNAVAIDAASRVASANQGYTPGEQGLSPATQATPQASAGKELTAEQFRAAKQVMGGKVSDWVRHNGFIVQLKDASDYADIPAGATYRDPQGTIRQKGN
jgi:hypothetical protein